MGNAAPAPAATEAPSACPIRRGTSGSSPAAVVVEECPVKYKNAKQYNVRGEVIDSKNQMPALAQQKPAPGQLAKLSTERVPSTIPKGGTDNDTWQYPSPQQFWNALVRKGKTEGAEEEAIDAVIAIHNNMNENTWRQVLAWEAMYPVTRPGGEPKLLRFQGRPDELSPKARLKILFGHPAPFDRHDWVVDRGGTEVRYVIDYYHDESGVGQDARPLGLEDSKSIRSIKVDVRPALDSFTSVADRVLRMPLQQARGATAFQPPPFFPPKAMVEAEKGRGAVIAEQWVRIQASCAADKELLKGCKSEDECGAATVKLQRCTAGIVCPDIVSAFDKCAASRASDAETGKAYTHMVRCLELFEIESRNELSKGR